MYHPLEIGGGAGQVTQMSHPLDIGEGYTRHLGVPPLWHGGGLDKSLKYPTPPKPFLPN